DDLGSGRRRANALGFLQAFPQNLIIDKAPGILHRLDQSAFVVTRRWAGGSRCARSATSRAIPAKGTQHRCRSRPGSIHPVVPECPLLGPVPGPDSSPKRLSRLSLGAHTTI